MQEVHRGVAVHLREKNAEEEKKRKEAERVAMLSIDWQDFTVVHTLEFEEDQDDLLPAPLGKEELLALDLVKMKAFSARGKQGGANGANGEDDDLI